MKLDHVSNPTELIIAVLAEELRLLGVECRVTPSTDTNRIVTANLGIDSMNHPDDDLGWRVFARIGSDAQGRVLDRGTVLFYIYSGPLFYGKWSSLAQNSMYTTHYIMREDGDKDEGDIAQLISELLSPNGAIRSCFSQTLKHMKVSRNLRDRIGRDPDVVEHHGTYYWKSVWKNGDLFVNVSYEGIIYGRKETSRRFNFLGNVSMDTDRVVKAAAEMGLLDPSG